MEKKGGYASLRPMPSLKKKKSKARGEKKGDHILTDGPRHTSSIGVQCIALCQDELKSQGLGPNVCLGQWESISFGSGLMFSSGAELPKVRVRLHLLVWGAWFDLALR